MEDWYCFRNPETHEIIAATSGRSVSGIAESGFVIAPFIPHHSGLITIRPDKRLVFPDVASFTQWLDSSESSLLRISPKENPVFPFPERSTTRAEHHREVSAFADHHSDRGGGKTIAARVMRVEKSVNLRKLFVDFCDAYPDAFTFAFSTPKSGTWIGASPELLLRISGDTLSTMALAGTRKVGTSGDWDGKNLREQKLVTDFILSVLEEYGLRPLQTPIQTFQAGPVEHLCTRIEAMLPLQEGDSRKLFFEIATSLSPTPALCGDIRSESMDLISRYENFERAYYGGFIGETGFDNRCALYVNLRSARVRQDAAALYAGGGITNESTPVSEWSETEEKFKTIRTFIEKQ